MKVLLVWLLVFGWTAPALSADKAEQRPIQAAAGEEFDIKLKSDPRSDFQWLVAKPLDSDLITFVRRSFQRPSAKSSDGSGTEILTFKAVAEGRTSVHLKYCQIRAQAAPANRSTNFVVQISRAVTRQQK